MAISTLLAVISDFEANAIGVGKECCPIVGSVLSVEFFFRSLDTSRTKLIGNCHNISD
jgi:hypothetical protein